eukprot:scaffold15966_cov249-Amphora_coffeaeformis.AAC.1
MTKQGDSRKEVTGGSTTTAATQQFAAVAHVKGAHLEEYIKLYGVYFCCLHTYFIITKYLANETEGREEDDDKEEVEVVDLIEEA